MESEQRPKNMKCEYVIPKFEDVNETYSPFSRDDNWDVYEVISISLLFLCYSMYDHTILIHTDY